MHRRVKFLPAFIFLVCFIGCKGNTSKYQIIIKFEYSLASEEQNSVRNQLNQWIYDLELVESSRSNRWVITCGIRKQLTIEQVLEHISELDLVAYAVEDSIMKTF